MKVHNPFHSPKKARENSAPHVLKLAEKVNEQIDAGGRVFDVPSGIAKSLASALEAAGWSVTLSPPDPALPGVRRVIITSPEDEEPVINPKDADQAEEGAAN